MSDKSTDPSKPNHGFFTKISQNWFPWSVAFTTFGFFSNSAKLEQALPTFLHGYHLPELVSSCVALCIILNLVRGWFRERKESLLASVRTQVTSIENQLGGMTAAIESLNPKIDDMCGKIRSESEQRIYLLLERLHLINEAYRKNLIGNWKTRAFDKKAVQQPFLKNICGLTADIFSTVWGISDAVITIKRCVSIDGDSTPDTVFTFSRSKECPDRDGSTSQNYSVAKNTAFTHASHKSKDKSGRYFYLCNDLSREPHYLNERPDFISHYQSTIVVPIQGPDRELTGFLTVDSMHTNVFQAESHLYLLAALADQMFNYLYISDELGALASDK